MYIVAIAWLYVALMMALTEPGIVRGVTTFLFYGLLPCGLFLWLVDSTQHKNSNGIPQQDPHQPDGTDS
jgi:hypothetical protein